jgi:regulator of RNase E activity RraA
MTDKYDHLTSAVIHDVMVYDVKYKGHFMLVDDIKMITGTKICGPAFTVTGEITFNRLAEYEEKARVIDMLSHFQSGEIEVLQPKYAGPLGTWGGFTAKLVRKFGCVGAVIDGYTRDVRELNEMGFSTYCRGTNLINGFGSGWQIMEFKVPITMPGPLGTPVSVNPGDYIVGDEDGVVRVPKEMIDDVAEFSEKRLARERYLAKQLDADAIPLEDWKKTIFDW